MTPKRTSTQLDFSHLPLLDHHCHPIYRPEYARGPLPSFLTESFDPELIARHGRHTLFFRRAVKELAQLLECDPTPEAVEEARAALPLEKFFALACREGKIEGLLLDDGYLKDQTQSLEWHHRTSGCQVARVLRLEVLIQDLIPQHSELAGLTAAYVAELDRAAPQIVSLKSIIAYRTGLDIRETSAAEAAAALAEVRKSLKPGQRLRIASKPLLDYLIPVALA
ncbi:MAG: amidohydrolase, partial [Deinococcus sp.]|nr:amidohydrolase [Deinococcus sp.]